MPADGMIAATGNGSSARPGLGSSIDYQATCYMVRRRRGRGCTAGIGPLLPCWSNDGYGSYYYCIINSISGFAAVGAGSTGIAKGPLQSQRPARDGSWQSSLGRVAAAGAGAPRG